MQTASVQSILSPSPVSLVPFQVAKLVLFWTQETQHNPVRSMSPILKKGTMLTSCLSKCCCGLHQSVTVLVILDRVGLRWDKRKGEKAKSHSVLPSTPHSSH